METAITLLAIFGLFCVAWFLCEMSSEDRVEEEKPIKKIEKIHIRSTFTKNQKCICKKLNEVIDRLNGVEIDE